MLNLRDDLTAVGSNQSQLARHIGVSPAAVTQMIKYDLWPTTRGLSKALLKERITAYLSAKGLSAERLARTFDEAPATPRANAELQAMAKANNSGPQPGSTQGEDPFMLLRHHSLSSAARQHFKVPRDPFINELNEDADVFITDDIRYVRAAMRHTARHGGMLAVVAESGGGKSTLRQDMIDWINTTGERVTVIEPYVIGMEDNQRKGKALMAADITGAVIRAVSPGTPLRQMLQDRAAQMHNILKASAQVGQRQIEQLLIDEARAGRRVVRLKGGDPLLFGRGGEEMQALAAAGLRYEVTPGVSAALGAAAMAHLPLTHRDHAQGCTLVTGHRRDDASELAWAAHTHPGATVVVYMGVRQAGAIAQALMQHGRAADTPAAVIEAATTPRQRVIRTRLDQLGAAVAEHDAHTPALLVIGPVLAVHDELMAAVALSAADNTPCSDQCG